MLESKYRLTGAVPDALLTVALLCALLSISGCSQAGRSDLLESRSTVTESAAAPSGPLALPALGSPADYSAALRGVQFTVENGGRLGSEYEPGLPHHSVVDAVPTLSFQPGNGKGEGYAYATYAFELPNADSAASLHLTWTETLPASYLYLGLANWATNRWDWVHATDSTQLNFDSLTQYTDESNRVLAVVMVAGSSGGILEQLQFSRSAPPHAQLDADYLQPALNLDVHLFAGNSSDDVGVTDYQWDLDGDGVFAEPGPEADSAGTIWGVVSYPVAGNYQVSLRVYDEDGSYSVESVDITAIEPGGGPGNEAPIAALSISPPEADANVACSLTLDAGDSADAEGPIVKYEWDLDNDQIFAEDGQEALYTGSFAIYLDYTPADKNDVIFGVRVTDSFGITNATYTALDVKGWNVVHLTSATPIHKLSMAEIDNRPALAYSLESATDADVYYAIADDAIADNIWAWTTVKVGDYVSSPNVCLQKIDGQPAIAIGLTGQEVSGIPRLEYRRASDMAGDTAESWNGDGSCTLSIDETAAVQADQALSMTQVGGQPAIAYMRENSDGTPYSTLYYSHAGSSDGTLAADWSAPVAMHIKTDSGDDDGYGLECSLKEVAGRPAVAYLSEDPAGYRQVWYNASASYGGDAAASWSSPGPFLLSYEYDGPADQPLIKLGGLSLIGGYPAVAYSDPVSQVFRYRRAASLDGGLPADWAVGENTVLPYYGEGNSILNMCVPMMIYVRKVAGEEPEVWKAVQGTEGGSVGPWDFDTPKYGPITQPGDQTSGTDLCTVSVASRMRAACLSNDRTEILYMVWN